MACSDPEGLKGGKIQEQNPGQKEDCPCDNSNSGLKDPNLISSHNMHWALTVGHPWTGVTRWIRHSPTSHGAECLGRDTNKWTSNMDDSTLTEGYGHLARHGGQKRILIESDILWWLFSICPQIYSLSFYALGGWLLTDFINQAPLPLWLLAGPS